MRTSRNSVKGVSAVLKASALLAVLLGSAACGKIFGASDYFPTDKGLKWDYAIQYSWEEDKKLTHLSMSALGEGKVYLPNDKVATYPVRQSHTGTDYYIDEQDDGYYRVAKRLVVELKPKPDEKPLLILPKGKNLRKGYTWSQMGNPYTVQWKPPFTEMNASIKPFDMLYEIAALNDTVETPAGKFENCVRVEAYGRMVLYADPRTGYTEVDVAHREWYAPGVGLVKLERDEPVRLNAIEGGKISMVLTGLKTP